ncbi:hypothetical protein OIU91_39375 [Streptomyces sp. NBC_01456]|uniref:hypothetical protein n=1 Tax=unclassified Streptomyces TaxID=2593676 RepID=UPI002E2EC484|nr:MULTISPECIES: hypothetical protein [unclassified Streptomyces]
MPVAQDIKLGGRGVLLMPTFHWTGHPLLSDLPDRPLTVTCPAGPGLPLPADGATGADQALAAPTPPRLAGRGGPDHHGSRGASRTAPAHRPGGPAGAAARLRAAGRRDSSALRDNS